MVAGLWSLWTVHLNTHGAVFISPSIGSPDQKLVLFCLFVCWSSTVNHHFAARLRPPNGHPGKMWSFWIQSLQTTDVQLGFISQSSTIARSVKGLVHILSSLFKAILTCPYVHSRRHQSLQVFLMSRPGHKEIPACSVFSRGRQNKQSNKIKNALSR